MHAVTYSCSWRRMLRSSFSASSRSGMFFLEEDFLHTSMTNCWSCTSKWKTMQWNAPVLCASLDQGSYQPASRNSRSWTRAGLWAHMSKGQFNALHNIPCNYATQRSGVRSEMRHVSCHQAEASHNTDHSSPGTVVSVESCVIRLHRLACPHPSCGRYK